MNDIALKERIKENLQALNQPDFSSQAVALFTTLGYDTSRQAPFPQKSWQFFKDTFLQPDSRFNENKAMVNEWQSVDLLFQLSQAELSGQLGLFETKRVDNTIIETYLFLAIELKSADYSRTALAQITREVNKVFPMPVMVLFKYGPVATLAVINRRLHKKDEQRDVLEKVTVIKDISLVNPHRAHIEILFDLSLGRLKQVHPFTNFVELHNAWQKTLDTKELNKRFYRELSNWYFWAMQQAAFPDDTQKDKEIRNATNLIRLLTRILFVWFIKEKKLVPESLFEPREVQKLLKQFNQDASSHSYYNAILQNLFFATLNQKIEERAFASDGSFAQNKKNYGIKNLYRYADQFTVDPAGVIALFRDIPFLNGGLFDCLDKDDPTGKVIYEDGFSRNAQKQAILPDTLFFSPEIEVDLSQVYDDKKRSREKVKGLIPILTAYKFTVTENTPIEEDIALDPELLGRVFENLLASYNPETQTTARKQTGSFYTPREIVNYMVDESLKAYLGQKLESEAGMKADDAAVGLEYLLGYNERENPFNDRETGVLIRAIDSCKILDPACGSGAFPMGILHKLVHCLHKLDPQNSQWKERQIEKAQALDDPAIRDNLIEDIETAFANNELDYGRKLYLIENCIYGVDIQPIATQISKLRFFISLIVDQKADRRRENFGIRPLPNLETKFVAANTLIGVNRPKTQLSLFDTQEIKSLEEQLKEVRHRLFSAKTPASKRRLREEDKKLREKMGGLLVANGWGNESARQLAGWDPYDQNTTAPFFDPEWMFGGGDGFDVVIGNPPYIFARESKKKGLTDEDKKYFYKNYQLAEYQVNLYPLFIEKGTWLLRANGCFCFITPNNWLTINTNKKLRKFVLGQSDITIVNFYARVFESAAVDSAIIIFRKSVANQHIALYEYTDGLKFIEKADCDFFLSQRDHVINIEAFKGSGNYELIVKIESWSDRLGDVADVKVGLKAYQIGKGQPPQTAKEKEGRIFHSPKKLSESYFKYLDGKDVVRYSLNWSGMYLKYGDHLAEPRKDFRLFSSKRILVRQIPGLPPYCIHACLIEETTLNDLNSMNIINIRESPECVLGILNSRLISFWFIHKFNKMQRETFPQFKVNELADFPLPKNRAERSDEITMLVAQILAAKKANPAANVRPLEAAIDRLVYELYGLTAEEITIVEAGV